MMSVISSINVGGIESPLDQGNIAVGEEPAVASTRTGGSDGRSAFSSVAPSEEAAWVSLADGGGSDETTVSDNVNDPRVLVLDNEENRFGGASGGVNQPNSCVGNSKRPRSRNGTLDQDKTLSREEYIVGQFCSIVSKFNAEFLHLRMNEAVEHGYEIGDMVWGKVKSHPWWPGYIYNEAFASPSVRRSKHVGQVLVAFFGDSSYGWFDPVELISFEKNFAEKSRQTMSRVFLKAVEEAVDELSRRSSLGLACRCRNEFNFSPSNVEGHFVVDVGDNEPGVYGLGQIRKARNSFRPREMLSFIQELALEPMNDQQWTIDFIKNKATVLACRKVTFEEFDETYLQAFGIVPVRRPRPTTPVAVDPSKAPLSGRLVIAEALGTGKISVKPTRTKDQVDKDKYLFKQRDGSTQIKSKKACSRLAGPSPHPLLVDGLGFSEKVTSSSISDHAHKASESGITDGQHQPMSHQLSISCDIKHSEGSRKLVEGGIKKAKIRKRPAGELSAEPGILIEKKKKRKRVISIETSRKLRQFPSEVSTSAGAVENVSGMCLHVPPIDNDGPADNHMKDAVVGSPSVCSQQDVDFGKLELRMLVTDLHALALNPFHGEQRSCPAVIQQVFLKYRSLVYKKSSLVYQKSLVLSPPVENVASEVNASRSPTATVSVSPVGKTNDKIVKSSVRFDGPTKGGKKRSPFDHLDSAKKKKQLGLKEIKKMKVEDSKKKIVDSVQKKIVQKSTESQREDVKEMAAKYVPPAPPQIINLASNKRMEPAIKEASLTMLVMKFPAGAALPSSAELRAKFARFGPLDHSATRVFWKSYTCRLVYQYKVDAEAALKFAVGSSNLFGSTSVRCYLREQVVEAVESEAVKLQKEDVSQLRNPAAEQTKAPKNGAPTLEHQLQRPRSVQQLKSCLKKPSADDGGRGGATVKFVLGGDESIKGESRTGARAPLINEKLKNNDISEEMLNLLSCCSNVVNNLRNVLGYIPYHPL